MKFADLNFAWADARAAVATDASVAKKVSRTVETVRITCDTVAAPAASVSLAAKAARRQQLASTGRKTPVAVKAKTVDSRWVNVLTARAAGLDADAALEVVKTFEVAKEAQAKAVKAKATASLVAPTVKKEVAVIALPAAPVVVIKKAANTPEVKARLKAAKAARKAEAVKAKKAAVKAMKLEKVRAKAEADLAAAQAAVAEGINKEAIEAVVGTEVAQAAINAEFARLINSIKTLQARTYVFNGKDKVSYTDTRTGVTSYYVVEWKAHEVVSFKAQG